MVRGYFFLVIKARKAFVKRLTRRPFCAAAFIKNDSEYEELLQNVGDALTQGRQRVASYIGVQTVRTYWEIGKYIVEYEQRGNEKAEYGSDLLNRLSKDMKDRYGKGFGRSSIYNMRKLFLTYPKIQTLSGFLTWSHYVELLKITDPLERSFYEKQAENENWGVRELKRQKNSMLFQRLALSTDKDSVHCGNSGRRSALRYLHHPRVEDE